MKKSKVTHWKAGDIFLIPLRDGDQCIGQIIGREAGLLNSLKIAIFDLKGAWEGANEAPKLDHDDIFSILDVTRDLIDSGRWMIIFPDSQPPRAISTTKGPAHHPSLIGSRVIGSGIVEEFVNAFYGLTPWDDWYIPNYLDKLLVTLDKKPNERIIMSGRHSA